MRTSFRAPIREPNFTFPCEGGGIDEEEVTIPALVNGTERKRKSFHSYDSSVSRFYVTYMMSGGNGKCEMEWNGDACSDGSFSLSSHLQ